MELPSHDERAAMQAIWDGGPGPTGTLHEWRIFELAWFSGRDWARAEMARVVAQQPAGCMHYPPHVTAAHHTALTSPPMGMDLICEDCGARGHLECEGGTTG